MTEKNVVETAVVRPSISFLQDGVEYKMLDTDQESLLEVAVYDVTSYVEGNSGYGKSDNEKDKLYEDAQKYWKYLAETLQNSKFNFYLNKDQHNFLNETLRNKIEYDSNTIFLAMEITNLLDTIKGTKFTDANQLLPFKVNATEITYVYHLLAKYKVKGINKDSYLFADILKRIGHISKVINFYDAGAKALSGKIQQWVASFEEPSNVVEEAQTV